MPRTDNPKKRAIRFCGDCGYELAPQHDGPCPMCPRFEQLRMDFAVPRPSELATRRAETAHMVSVSPGDWPPTPSEYRAILAERRLGSTSAEDMAVARVIRTPGLTQIRVPAPPPGTNAPGDDDLSAPSTEPKPARRESSPTSSKKPKGRRGKGGDRRAARARARAPASQENVPSAVPSSSAAPGSADDVPATNDTAGVRRNLEAPVGAIASDWVPTPGAVARYSPQTVPLRRRAFRSRTVAAGPSLVAVAIVVAGSALIGAAIPILLSLL